MDRTAGTETSLADKAYAAIQRKLLFLDIAPGEAIHDAKLAEEFGMGRTPVREALKRLEVDRLVISYPKRGTFATRVEITDLSYISEVRTQLEPMAAARAARVASPEQRAGLKNLIEQLKSFDIEEATTTEVLECDASIHRAIYSAAGNPHLEDSLIRYNNLATRIWCLVIERLPRVADHVTESVALLQAIIDGDEDKASELAHHHVSDFESSVHSALFSG
ncbi:GntR family transcriptional regulator [Glutamicibacter endophyticus]|uniref:GntR family transcriptional regulator n=1 Tax=Glutamicibacter endophyticus TaxID=1522174 RepID=UPI003AF08758